MICSKLQIRSVTLSDSAEGFKKEQALASKSHPDKSNIKAQISPHEHLKGGSSRSSSIDLSSELEGHVNCHAPVSNSPNSSPFISKKGIAHAVQSSSSFISNENGKEEDSPCLRGNDHENLAEVQRKLPTGKPAISVNAEQNCEEVASNNFSAKLASLNEKHPLIQEIGSSNSSDSQVNRENDANGKTWRMGKVSMEEGAYLDDYCNDFVKYRMEQEDNGLEREIFEKGRHSAGDEPLNFCSRNATRNQVSLGSDSPSPIREDPVNFGTKRNLLKSDRLKNVRSVRSSSDIARSNGNQKEVKENGVLGDAPNRAGSFGSPERKDYKVYPRDSRSAVAESKIQQLEHKINMLETELREAAAIEASLYSVVAEHGSSMSKVHAPARRLSRLYLHACKEDFQSRRASAARSAVSGLVLVAKACGNDVPRWVKSHYAFLCSL